MFVYFNILFMLSDDDIVLEGKNFYILLYFIYMIIVIYSWWRFFRLVNIVIDREEILFDDKFLKRYINKWWNE